jgi:hypothetical protein
MSRLRNQFQIARNAYAGVSYPGDLPADVLGPFVPHHWYKWPVRVGFGGLAVAAAIAWVILLSHPSVKPPGHEPRFKDDHRDTVAVAPMEAPGLPLSPPAMPQMPEMPDLSGMPALPTMPAGFTGSVVPQKTPSLIPDMIPLEPPGIPPTIAPAVPHGASSKEPA